MTNLADLQIDRYEIQQRLGAGGMARVYKAWDTNLERTVAIKVLHEHLAEDPTFKERFEREAKLIANLNHPNIIQVYDFNTAQLDGFPVYYMVMSYIAGQTLRELLADHAERGELLSYERVWAIMTNLTEALHYAHKAGMVHRDVKPANILFNDLDQAVLTDFGIARLIASSRLTQDGTSTGTPAYMSPEQASGHPGDMRSDLYSLGVILYEMLTGRPPYADEGGLSLMYKHINEPVPLLSQVMPNATPELDTVLLHALAKNPDDRYQTAREFIAALKRAFAGSLVDFTPDFDQMAEPRTTQSTRPVVTDIVDDMRTSQPQIVRSQWESGPQPTVSRRPLLLYISLALALVSVVTAAGLVIALRPASDAPDTSQSAVASLDDDAVESMTGNFYFTSTFDADDINLQYWPQGMIGGFLQEATGEGIYRLYSERPSTASTSIFNSSYTYDNVSINMTASLGMDSNPASAYGIVFRYIDEDHFHVFAVDGLGRFSIWVREQGQWVELRQLEERWTRSDDINEIGASNTLRLDVLGDLMTGYVNGEQMFTLRDGMIRQGNVGIYLANHDEGTASVLVDRYQVIPAAPPSMTGG